MKDKIHPKYVETTVKCACGFEYKTYSTRENIRVDICSQCHPYYTGKTKIIDAAGRVERYRRRFGETKGSEILTAKQKEKLEEEDAARKTGTKKKPVRRRTTKR
ncbi:50S ribosomal protein L31 [candidate division WOR-3 bacterium]|nr:50S ribosomal protein L31 [candidate division WOR-3 bacterium]